ncbi:DUF4274 domain-containing protein [Aquimarina litoralis]|uniref:DUF4274 domain-containing protein n=1 Tax=Aquimarina litoralis TaxID=584605 RepID=UPI001C56AA75|nr:DUF4274 domain-containing protein [Aquimarina litoralis]MBW1294831.1 DUF4274 domain-containing protein [Aquimarina litoralis]
MDYKTKAEKILNRKLEDDETLDDFFEEVLLKLIPNLSPKIWHQMVMEWNWDSYSSFLNWLIENPKTDKATVLMIYWKSEPRYDKDFEFVEKIEQQYLNDFYQQSNFLFDPKDDLGEDWTVILSDSHNRNIPKAMLKKLDGEKISVPDGFIEGIPPNIDDLFQELYNEYD